LKNPEGRERVTKRIFAFACQQQLYPDRVDISALIEKLRQLATHSLGKGIQVDCRFGTEIWPTLIDPNQLKTDLFNLAVTAPNAMDGRGRLRIEIANMTLAGDEHSEGMIPMDYVAIIVSDNGIGVPAEVRAKVFEPFFTIKPVGQGAGLGPSQLYGLVKQSGGSIEIESEPGEGTRVRLYLPRAQQ
jgi:signal transduction histidine kinase